MASGSIINDTKSNTYSTNNEIVVGYYNGSPIYRKTLTTTSPTVTSDGTWVEKVVTNIPYATRMSLRVMVGAYPLPYSNNSGRMIKAFFGDNGDIKIASNGTAFNNVNTLIVAEYTKS